MNSNNRGGSGSFSANHKLLAVLLAGVTGVLLLLVWGSAPPRGSGSSVHAAVERTQDGSQLLLVQVAHRHGARTPLSLLYWPDEPYSDCAMEFPGAKIKLVDEAGSGKEMSLTDLGQGLLPGGCRMGQLTSTGYSMAKDLGAWLRKRYVRDLGFLSPTWKAEEVWARTTRYHRTLQTLQGVLTGLWPDLSHPPPGGASPPTVVKVLASEEHDEYAYGSNATCAKLGPLLQAAQRAVEARDAQDQPLASLAQDVAQALALPGGAQSIKWVRLYDTLAAMMAHPSSKVPKGATDHLFTAITQQAVRHEADIITPFPGKRVLPDPQCHEVMRLSIGPLLWHLQHNMAGAANEAAKRGLLLHPAGGGAAQHDMTTTTATNTTTVKAQEATERDPEQPLAKPPSSSAASRAGKAAVDRQQHLLARRLGQGGDHHAVRVSSRSLSGSGTAATSGATTHPRLFIFSGHDATITPMLGALGIYETDWPPFTSSLVFELWSVPGPAAAAGKDPTPAHAPTLWVRIWLDRKALDVTHLVRQQQQDGEASSSNTHNSRKPSDGWLTMADLVAQWQPLALSVDGKRAECLS